MLDLEPGVGLDEHVAAVSGVAAVDEELDRTDAPVADLARQPQGVGGDPLPHGVGQRGAGCHLDQLLMPALEAALPFPEVADRAPVADDLHLDVARLRQQLLGEQGAVPEGRCRLRPAPLVGLWHRLGGDDDAGAATATAGRRLQHHRSARSQRGQELGGAVDGHRRRRSPQHGHPQRLGEGTRRGLVAEQRQYLGRRPHEPDAHLGAAPGEEGVLAEEAVAGVEGVAAGLDGDLQHALDVQVRRRADLSSLHDTSAVRVCNDPASSSE